MKQPPAEWRCVCGATFATLDRPCILPAVDDHNSSPTTDRLPGGKQEEGINSE